MNLAKSLVTLVFERKRFNRGAPMNEPSARLRVD